MSTDKFYTLTNDKVFKVIFSKEKNRDILEELLYEVTDTRFKVITLLAQELPKRNVHSATGDVSVTMKQSCLYFEISIPTKYIKKHLLISNNALYVLHKTSINVFT